MLFWTRHAGFRRVENDIYDPSARIIKNPLNSTIFWTRHLNSATRPLNSAMRQKCNYDPSVLPTVHGFLHVHCTCSTITSIMLWRVLTWFLLTGACIKLTLFNPLRDKEYMYTNKEALNSSIHYALL